MGSKACAARPHVKSAVACCSHAPMLLCQTLAVLPRNVESVICMSTCVLAAVIGVSKLRAPPTDSLLFPCLLPACHTDAKARFDVDHSDAVQPRPGAGKLEVITASYGKAARKPFCVEILESVTTHH